MTPREHLLAARALIERPENWGKGHFIQWHGETPAYCASGALNYAMTHSAVWMSHSLAYQFMGSSVGCSPLKLSDWNDAEERTHSEVLAAFDRAIELAEKQPLLPGATA